MSIAKELPVKEPGSGSFASQLQRVLRENIRDYGMFIALFVIWIVFAVLTDGLFISSRNISNLLNQFGYIAVLGIGMTLVIVIRHIDLSVGFLAGFLGALAAIAMTSWGLPVWVVVPAILLIGALLGLVPGFLVARLGIPAFVATLAGFLIYRGAILVVTEGSGTIIISDDAFNAIGNGFIPDPFNLLPGVHLLTLLLGVVAIVFLIYNEIKSRRTKMAYNF
jgi:putative multiple sugar transport system permease protein